MAIRKVVFVVLTLAAAAGCLKAQDNRRFDVFGGYSLERVAPCGHVNGGCGVESGDLLPQTVFNGWIAAATGYFSRRVGITGDFSGHYHTFGGGALSPDEHLSRLSYMFGPKFPLYPGQSEKSTIFFQLLAGAVHQKLTSGGVTSAQFTGTKFGARPGGGWDLNLNRHFAVRVAQIEYEYIRVPLSSVTTGSSFTNGFRYSGGVVFH
jgi:hypothetical protein